MRPVVDLPHPELSDERQCFTGGDIERNAIHGLDLTRGAGIEDAT